MGKACILVLDVGLILELDLDISEKVVPNPCQSSDTYSIKAPIFKALLKMPDPSKKSWFWVLAHH